MNRSQKHRVGVATSPSKVKPKPRGKKYLAGSSLSVDTAVARDTSTPVVDKNAVARVAAQFGNPKRGENKFDKTVRAIVSAPLVLYHQCQQKLDGHGARCTCTAKIPGADAEKLIAQGIAKYVVATRNGQPYEMKNSIVALVPKFVPAKKEVRVHACFNFRTENKPERCYCQSHLTRPEAAQLVKEGKAQWLEVTRDGTAYELHNAVVLTAEEIEQRKTKIKDAKSPALLRLLAEVRPLKLTRDEVLDGLAKPDDFCGTHPNIRHAVFWAAVRWYWNKILVDNKLGLSRGMFMPGAPRGAGGCRAADIPRQRLSTCPLFTNATKKVGG